MDIPNNIESQRIEDRIFYLFRTYPSTIGSDRELFKKYLEVFHRVGNETSWNYAFEIMWINKLSITLIENYGKKIKNKFPELFNFAHLSTLSPRGFYSPSFPEGFIIK